ncbi:mitochondrial ribosomal protein L48 [Cricetulus griseus]
MSGTLGKVLGLWKDTVSKQAFSLLRFRILGENPICSAASEEESKGGCIFLHLQISGLSATFAEIFLEILQRNLPEGVRLSVREHSEEDFKGRFKARPELEELLAKLN